MKVLRCPAWMGKFGRDYWQDLAPRLIRANVLTELDKGSFEALCLSYHLMKQSGIELMNDGFTVKAERGDTVKKVPAFTVYKTNTDIYRKLAEGFGLMPLARERLTVQEPSSGEWDEFESMLDKGR